MNPYYYWRWIQWRTEEGRGGDTFWKNLKIYVKMVKFTLKKVNVFIKADKRAEN